MGDIFSNLYGQYVEDIHNFLNSDSNILYVSGFSGSGKSSVLKNALENWGKKILNFHHLCFEKTVADDFLLSFYDTFRMYALKQTIILGKNPEEEFVQKVNFYFKNLEFPAVVVIDNFETVPDDSDINDLLIHISGFENVKVILISKNPACRLSQNPTISIEHINFEKINFEQFKKFVSPEFPNVQINVIEKLYKATDGFELYLKMVLSYLESMSISLSDFMEEFESKEIPFEDFIVEKQVSLIPANYYPILKNLACINHNVPLDFIQVYDLGDVKQIPYLHSKFMISEFWETYHIKSYLRNYFEEITSLQDKIQSYKKFISIYNNELKKSPKDRILRMSRESIRNQIASLENKLPKVAKANASFIYNYVPAPVETTAQWFITGNKGGVIKHQKPIKKRPKQIEAKMPDKFEELILEASKFEEEYDYKNAVITLENAKKETKNLSNKITVFSKLASDLLKINDNNGAISSLSELCAECKKAGDIDSYAKYRIETGKIHKKLYAFSKAKAYFSEISGFSDLISPLTLALAKIALADIYELENNSTSAINEYKEAIELLPFNSEYLPEISYKLAVLEDEAGLYEDALQRYFDSINYADTTGSDLYLSKCYTACGVIYADLGQTQDALSYLEYALELARNSENYLDAYYIARNIAGVYRNIEPEKSYDYLTLALDYAKTSGNSFEIAISLLELGDYYYDSKQNEQALICYFQAKTTLGSHASKENTERVLTRINDMKIKLGEYVFNGMKALYDPE